MKKCIAVIALTLLLSACNGQCLLDCKDGHYKPHASDCDVLHKGDAAATKACLDERIKTFNSGNAH